MTYPNHCRDTNHNITIIKRRINMKNKKYLTGSIITAIAFCGIIALNGVVLPSVLAATSDKSEIQTVVASEVVSETVVANEVVSETDPQNDSLLIKDQSNNASYEKVQVKAIEIAKEALKHVSDLYQFNTYYNAFDTITDVTKLQYDANYMLSNFYLGNPPWSSTNSYVWNVTFCYGDVAYLVVINATDNSILHAAKITDIREVDKMNIPSAVKLLADNGWSTKGSSVESK